MFADSTEEQKEALRKELRFWDKHAEVSGGALAKDEQSQGRPCLVARVRQWRSGAARGCCARSSGCGTSMPRQGRRPIRAEAPLGLPLHGWHIRWRGDKKKAICLIPNP